MNAVSDVANNGVQPLKQFISDRINDWIEFNPKRNTMLRLAELSRVGYSTIRRHVYGEGESNLQTFLQLAQVVLNPEETRKALATYFPEVKLGEFRFIPPKFKDPIRSKEALLIIAHSCPDNGIELEELERIVGTRNTPIIHTLLEEELLKLQDGRVKLAADYYFSPDSQRIVRWIRYVAELFDHLNADKAGQFSTFRIEGLNGEGIEEVSKILIEAEKSIQFIINEKKYRGDISMATVLLSTLFPKK